MWSRSKTALDSVPLVAVTVLGGGIVDAHPFVRFAGIIQAEVVVNGLGREHRRQALGQRLQAIERAVAADANQPLDAQLLQARRRPGPVRSFLSGST